MDQVSSGALGTPWQTGSQASGTEPGRPAAPQAEWLDVAVLLRGRIAGNPDISGIYPQYMSVERIATATGRLLGVIYRRDLGDTSSVSGPMSDPLTLIADAPGSSLILDGGICNRRCTNEFNGWLHGGTLVPLPPAGFAHREAAEAW